MATKIDKETLIKHRFWILLGAFVPLWLIALIILLGVASLVEAKRKEYTKQVDVVTKINNPNTKSEHYIDPLKEQESKLRDQKLKVWGEVWDSQIDPDTKQHFMDDWPYNDKTPTLQRLAREGKFFGPINDERELVTYRDQLYKKYVEQKRDTYEKILAKYPAQPGYTPVQINWDKVMPIRELKPDKLPTSEECWLAQEELWIKQQLFRAIRDALDASARFEPEKDVKPLPNTVGHYLFRNPNWELDLRIEAGEKKGELFISPKSLIKNINKHKRRLELRDVYILLRQKLPNGDNTVWMWFLIQGKPLTWNQAAEIGSERIRIDDRGFTATAPMEAEQWFKPSTCPIKRIDDIEIGYNSDRTSKVADALRPFVKEEAPAGQGAGGGGDARGGAPGGVRMGAGSTPPQGGNTGTGQMGGKGGESAPSELTPSGFKRNRYVQVTPQVRRIPIAVVLTVDQAYMQDIRTAFSNSRLRFQPTQDHWHHDAGGIQSAGTSTDRSRGSGGGGGGSRGMEGSRGGSREGGPPPGGAGMGSGRFGSFNPEAMRRGGGDMPVGSVPPSAGGGDAIDSSDPNLVELVIYGVISLYDRPTEAPKGGDKPKEGDQPKKDGTPKDTPPKEGDQPKKDAAPKDTPPKDADKKPGTGKDK
jgi:hypothetical protein